MAHFEIKIYHHKVASFKDVCMVVVMVLGEKAQKCLPSSPLPPPPIIVSSPVADILEVFLVRGLQMCASKSSNNGYYFYKIIILAMLRIMQVT